MLIFILNRLCKLIPMMFVMAAMTFFLMQKTPGNFLDTIRLDPTISEETIKHYQKLYHLDQPAWLQFFHWLKNLIQIDLDRAIFFNISVPYISKIHCEFGYSFYYNVPVSHIIGTRLWNTFVLSLASFLLTWLMAIPLGIWAAVNRNHWIDRVIQIFSYVFLSLPSFFIAMILLFWASQTGVLPLGGMVSPHFDDLNPLAQAVDILKHLFIPTMALSLGSIASLQKLMRGNMIEVLGQQYILAARAKGLPENKVIYHHALRNALNPLMTLLGYELAGLLSGAALIEILCSWPGLGALMWTAVRSKDIYLVMANMMMGGVLYILGNLVADIFLAKLDPRIRYDKR